MLRAFGLFALADAVLLKMKTGGHPIEKVVTMLQSLERQSQKQMEDTDVNFAKYQEWCRNTANEVNYRVGQDQKKVEKLALKIEGYKGDIDVLTKEISDNEELVKKTQYTVDKDVSVRKNQKMAFDKKYAKWTSAAKACDKAIVAIKAKASEMNDTDMDGVTIANFLQEEVALAAVTAQQPAGSQFSSRSILETLRNLVNTFKNSAQETYDEEQGRKEAAEMKISKNRQQIGFTQDTLEEQRGRNAELEEAKAGAEKTHGELDSDQQKNVEYLKEMKGDCKDKTEDYKEAKKTSEDELSALRKAIDTLSAGLSQFVVKEGFLQQGSESSEESRVLSLKRSVEREAAATSFLQMGVRVHRQRNYKLVQYLKNAGRELHSVALLGLAIKVSADASADPFVKIRELINDMVKKLEEQNKSETDQKMYCDKKEKEAIKQKDDAQSAVEDANGAIVKANASLVEAKKTIERTTDTIISNEKMKKEGKVQWEEEKRLKEEEEKNATGAKSAVEDALDILRPIYSGGSFLQQPVEGVVTNASGGSLSETKEAGGVADFAPSAGTQSADGVLGLLQSILSDYEQQLKDVTARLEQLGNDWETMEADLDRQIEEAEKQRDAADTQKSEAKVELSEQEEKLGTQKQLLETAKDALESLKRTCADTGMSFKERAAAREAEIARLKEAMKILKEIAPEGK